MGDYGKAEQVHEILREQGTKEYDQGVIYHQLVIMKYEQEQYAEAIAYYVTAMEIEQKQIFTDFFSTKIRSIVMEISSIKHMKYFIVLFSILSLVITFLIFVLPETLN